MIAGNVSPLLQDNVPCCRAHQRMDARTWKCFCDQSNLHPAQFHEIKTGERNSA
jgi:hypothetical protein